MILTTAPMQTIDLTRRFDELTANRTTGVVGFRSTVHNQRRELVLEGSQKFLIRRRPTQP